MAKTNEYFFFSRRSVGENTPSPKKQRGFLISLLTSADITAANDLEHTVMSLRVCLTNPGSRWESRSVVAANDDPFNVLPFISRQEAREIAQNITKRAEFIRHPKQHKSI